MFPAVSADSQQSLHLWKVFLVMNIMDSCQLGCLISDSCSVTILCQAAGSSIHCDNSRTSKEKRLRQTWLRWDDRTEQHHTQFESLTLIGMSEARRRCCCLLCHPVLTSAVKRLLGLTCFDLLTLKLNAKTCIHVATGFIQTTRNKISLCHFDVCVFNCVGVVPYGNIPCKFSGCLQSHSFCLLKCWTGLSLQIPSQTQRPSSIIYSDSKLLLRGRWICSFCRRGALRPLSRKQNKPDTPTSSYQTFCHQFSRRIGEGNRRSSVRQFGNQCTPEAKESKVPARKRKHCHIKIRRIDVQGIPISIVRSAIKLTHLQSFWLRKSLRCQYSACLQLLILQKRTTLQTWMIFLTKTTIQIWRALRQMATF